MKTTIEVFVSIYSRGNYERWGALYFQGSPSTPRAPPHPSHPTHIRRHSGFFLLSIRVCSERMAPGIHLTQKIKLPQKPRIRGQNGTTKSGPQIGDGGRTVPNCPLPVQWKAAGREQRYGSEVALADDRGNDER